MFRFQLAVATLLVTSSMAFAPAHFHHKQSTSALYSTKNDDADRLSRRSLFQQGILAVAAAGSSIVFGGPSPTWAASDDIKVGGKIVFGNEDIMSQKSHGTSEQPVQSDLLYGVSNKLADKICNYNRHFAEMGGYFTSTSFEKEVLEAKGPITFYDSVTGKPLFVAPLNRSPEEFVRESEIHGWPSFRDEEVVWENVRVLKNSGETVSVDDSPWP